MTQAQETRKAYEEGNKEQAYEMFKADPTANEMTFEAFCEAMERMIIRHRENETAEKATAYAWAISG